MLQRKLLMSNENTATCYNISFCKLVILHSNGNIINTNKNQSVLNWQLRFVNKFNCRLRPFNLNSFTSCSSILFFAILYFKGLLFWITIQYTPYLKAHKKGCVFTLFYTFSYLILLQISIRSWKKVTKGKLLVIYFLFLHKKTMHYSQAVTQSCSRGSHVLAHFLPQA